MGTRHTGRKLAMQVLFQADIQQALDITDVMTDYFELNQYHADTLVWAKQLVVGTWAERSELDQSICQYLKGWDIDRVNRIDLSLLRLAIYEMTALKTPATVVINEMLELAKKYGTDESSKFINGVLDTYVQDQCLQESSKD